MIFHTVCSHRLPAKSAHSAEIKTQIAAFKKSGGKVQVIPFGVCKQGSVDSMRQYPEVRGE